MESDITGGPAFPSVGEGFGNPNYSTPGMSLRDYLAAKAMQGLLAAWGHHDVEDFREIASDSYNAADAMLAERAKEQA